MKIARSADIILTAIAPVIWGTTYFVTTEFLPPGYPITVAALRALPAGLLLFAFTRKLPDPLWWGRVFLLGALNITVFLICLFVAAYRLPGGVAATVGATQPLLAVVLAHFLLGNPVRIGAMLAAITGLAGVGFLVLTADSAIDPVGLAAGVGGAVSMATGNVLAKKWKPASVPLVAFTSWQLIAGGLLLVPAALLAEPSFPPLTGMNIGALIWLSVAGAALTYVIWFHGVSRLEPSAISALLFLSPTTAVIIGWTMLDQSLGELQLLGVLLVLASIWASQNHYPAPARRGDRLDR